MSAMDQIVDVLRRALPLLGQAFNGVGHLLPLLRFSLVQAITCFRFFVCAFTVRSLFFLPTAHLFEARWSYREAIPAGFNPIVLDQVLICRIGVVPQWRTCSGRSRESFDPIRKLHSHFSAEMVIAHSLKEPCLLLN